MARHKVQEHVDILINQGMTREEVISKFNLYEDSVLGLTAGNKDGLITIKEAALKAAKKSSESNSKGFVEPYFFKNSDDEWAIMARGIDFRPDGSVKVRRRSGSASVVYVRETVDLSDAVPREYTVQ